VFDQSIIGLGSVENLLGQRINMTDCRFRIGQQPKHDVGQGVPYLLVRRLGICNGSTRA
jgi:hypothetical protein